MKVKINTKDGLSMKEIIDAIFSAAEAGKHIESTIILSSLLEHQLRQVIKIILAERGEQFSKFSGSENLRSADLVNYFALATAEDNKRGLALALKLKEFFNLRNKVAHPFPVNYANSKAWYAGAKKSERQGLELVLEIVDHMHKVKAFVSQKKALRALLDNKKVPSN